jgi:hypothetical protein
MSRTYGIAIDAKRVIINPDKLIYGYEGWWSCSAIDASISINITRMNYLDAIDDAIKSAQQFSKDHNIAFISEGGMV